MIVPMTLVAVVVRCIAWELQEGMVFFGSPGGKQTSLQSNPINLSVASLRCPSGQIRFLRVAR